MSKKLIMLIATLLVGVGMIFGAFRVGVFIGAQGLICSHLFINRYESIHLRIFMSDEEAKGRNEKTKGKIREEVGKMTGDKSEQIKGKAEQAIGKVQEEAGKAKKKIENKH